MRLVIAFGLAVVLAGCIAKRDMDECRKGDRSRCPGDARNKTMLAALPQPTALARMAGRREDKRTDSRVADAQPQLMKHTPLVTQDLTGLVGKEGVLVKVEYAPGASGHEARSSEIPVHLYPRGRGGLGGGRAVGGGPP